MKTAFKVICAVWRFLNALGLVLGLLALSFVLMGCKGALPAGFDLGHLLEGIANNALWLLVTPTGKGGAE